MKASVISKADMADAKGFDPFDAQEQQVLWLADRDPPVSVPAIRTGMSRIRNLLRGPQPNYTLANPRLETLRQTAIILRTGRTLSGEAVAAFDAAGYSRAQLDLLRVLFLTGRSRREVVHAA